MEKEFKEYLNKTASDMYDFAVHLYYYWLIIHAQKLSYRNADGSNYREIDATFPLKKEDDWYLLAKPEADMEFEKEAQTFIRYTFLDDPLKEMALVFWYESVSTGEEFPLTNKNCFHILSDDCRCLSILYDNFFEFKKVIDDSENFLLELDALRQKILKNAHELIGFWFSEDKKKQAGRRGGRQPKMKEGIRLAIMKALEGFQEQETVLGKERLWRYFEQHYDIDDDKEPLQIDNFRVFFSQGRLCQEVDKGDEVKIQSIGKDRFFKYVTKIKKNIGH